MIYGVVICVWYCGPWDPTILLFPARPRRPQRPALTSAVQSGLDALECIDVIRVVTYDFCIFLRLFFFYCLPLGC